MPPTEKIHKASTLRGLTAEGTALGGGQVQRYVDSVLVLVLVGVVPHGGAVLVVCPALSTLALSVQNCERTCSSVGLQSDQYNFCSIVFLS